MTNVLNAPTVRVRVGPPMALDLSNPEADTKAIMDAIVDLLPEEARRVVEPTAEQIARALPPGAKLEAASPA